ncbi:MAG: HAMP domain-containing sensor histidine kinase [Dehalococcoidia bacterium]
MFSAARWRLTIVFTAILVVILAVCSVVVYLTTDSLIYDRVDAELADKARDDERLVNDHKSPGVGGHESDPSQGAPTEDGEYEFDTGGYFFAIAEPSGEIYESSNLPDEYELASDAVLVEALENGHAITEGSAEDETLRIYVLAARDENGDQVFLEVGRSIEREQKTLSQLQTILLAVVGLSILPALGGGYLLSGGALRPIKRAIDAQRAFIADASHELRTPVAVVRTNAELLERRMGAGTIGQASSDSLAVEDILSESDRLGKMVGQMLTLAQADAGQTIVSPSDIPIEELAEEVSRSMRALAEARQIALTVRTDGETWVHGDRERLREVIVTLLDNAIKYTEPGGRIDVAVERDRKRARIAITDTGVGIPPEARSQIFKRFYRLDKARSRDEGGTGLGLAIAHQIVQAHGGSIRIDSEPGRGTSFVIELRLIDSPHPEVSPLQHEPGT